MAAAYVVEKSPLIIKILDMIPKLMETRKKFNKDDPRHKEVDETIDKLIAKLSGIFVSPETAHFPVMYEEPTLPGQEDDMPDTYIPTEQTTFDPSEHLRAAVSGSLNETSETAVIRETPEQRQAREEKEAKEQQDAEELMERWNNEGGRRYRKSRNQKKLKKSKSKKSKRRRGMRIF
jgi:hypothetical protein